jgi:hypothetical protein
MSYYALSWAFWAAVIVGFLYNFYFFQFEFVDFGILLSYVTCMWRANQRVKNKNGVQFEQATSCHGALGTVVARTLRMAHLREVEGSIPSVSILDHLHLILLSDPLPVSYWTACPPFIIWMSVHIPNVVIY